MILEGEDQVLLSNDQWKLLKAKAEAWIKTWKRVDINQFTFLSRILDAEAADLKMVAT